MFAFFLYVSQLKKSVMKTLFVVLFKAKENGHVYSSVGNYYFKTEEEARTYARQFVEISDPFSDFVISDVIPFK